MNLKEGMNHRGTEETEEGKVAPGRMDSWRNAERHLAFLSVPSVPLWLILFKIYTTAPHPPSLCPLCALCVSVVNLVFLSYASAPRL